MRFASMLIALVLFVPLTLPAGEKTPGKSDYAEFSKLVHFIVVRSLPKQIEDPSGWGQTVPVPPKLPLPQLRKFVKVGDKLELPHGAWRRFKGKIEEPAKNLKFTVKDFKALDEKTFRLVLDVDATIAVHGEWQQWQKGLLLIGFEAAGDANFTAEIVCDIGAKLNLDKFPPEINIEPKVKDLGLDLVDFKFRDLGPLIPADQANTMSKELKDVARTLIKASEPLVKEYANQAIAQSLKEGKGTISAATIMKSVPMPK